MTLLYTLALIPACLLNPWLLARHTARSADGPLTAALWGAMVMGLNLVVPLALHLSGWPISRGLLLCCHLSLALFLVVGAWLRHLPLLPPDMGFLRRLAVPLALFALLVLPVTHIAGIDTYKWQDLATAIQVEGSIPWLIHPLSLFGFTPRSYPSAQPLILASLQLVGRLDVDWGFYLLSVLCGATGLFSAYALGIRLFASASPAWAFAALYLFSPVSLRYNYWATGRGLLIDLLPLFILAWLRLPRPAAFAGLIATGLLLGLAHKTGLVALVLIPIAFAGSPLLRYARSRWVLAAACLCAVAAGLVLNGGHPLDMAAKAATRLGWLVPLAFAGLFGARTAPADGESISAPWDRVPSWRAMLAGGLVTLPLVFLADMYGALIALPFAAFAAAAGLQWQPPWWRPSTFKTVTAALTLATGLVFIVHQAHDSPSRDVYAAAQFLEQHDPEGPYRIEAPGRVRAQMQAYVSGCPRFSVRAPTNAAPHLRPFPARTGNWPADARRWIAWLRGAFDVSDTNANWYGEGTRVYHVTVDGEGRIPPGAPRLFVSGPVAVFGQTPP